ncbi:hypothetical protein E1301_Tti020632 [Triplophysa tibetana]|uniref:Uncharacterized protein n=1 Tax=Triplophysa tibetana TaxID=1572043 RepID=A0A5A9PG39_9TELE|nr:hypothetical protein E1301_Tti020632 [Triplophysa tibetana]
MKWLVVLCLLHLAIPFIQGDVNTVKLAQMIQYFDDFVQPKPGAQFAIALAVSESQCTDEHTDIRAEFSEADANQVKSLITNGQTCDLCTPAKNVIAARPNGTTKEHAEHILLFPQGSSPMDKLIKSKGSCIVFYSYNSPCVTKCISSDDNIVPGLSNWINIRKEKTNVFIFEKIWQKDEWRKDLDKEFLKVNAVVPLYRSKNVNNVMKSHKCVEKNTEKVIPFCLQDKKSILSILLRMFTSIFDLQADY